MGLKKLPKSLKICCITTSIIIVALFAAILILYFTLLKPKQPKLTTQQVILEHFKVYWNPAFHLNATIGLVVTVDNPNYGSFTYQNTTAYVTYRGTPAAQAPIEEDTIPARGKHDISTSVAVIGENLVTNGYFWLDYRSGCLNFTSSTTFHGTAKVLKIFKIKATTYSTCDISVYVFAENATSVCKTKLKY